MRKVLITLSKTFYEAYPKLEQNLNDLGLKVIPLISDEPVSKDKILEHIRDAEIYIVGVEKVDKEIIDAGNQLKYIAKHGAGLDNIDLDYAAKKNIVVTYTPAQNASTVADFTLGLILAISRHIVASNDVVKKGGWSLFMGEELENKTLGIVGFGSIGKAVARRAKGFGMRLIAYDIYKDQEAAQRLGVEFADLNTLLKEADYLTLHTALTEKTYHLINKEKLSLMKRSSYLINTSRGPIVVEEDLIDALKHGLIRGAALDVYYTEPPNSELVKLPNVVSTSHIGGSTYECAQRLGEITFRNIKKFLNNEKLDYVANGL